MNPDTLLVIPMKDPRRAKTRLAGTLLPAERARLARQLFERTLRVVVDLRASDATPRFDIAVVTPASDVAERANAHGVDVIPEQAAGEDLNAALTAAATTAAGRGYARMAVLPADLAAPDPEDIRRLLVLDLGARGLALCPATDFGTNALLAAPPDAVPFAFGPRSFHAHRAGATAAGLNPITLPLESLRWDIDDAGDFTRFLRHSPGAMDLGGDR